MGSDKDSGDDDWEVMIGRHYPITLPPVATRVVGTYYDLATARCVW